MENSGKQEQVQKEYWEYQRIKREVYRKVRVKKILRPFDQWFEKRFSFDGKRILDIGSLIESDVYRKFVRENGSISGYFGFDVCEDAVEWLKAADAFYDIYSTDERSVFDLITLVDVYEHLFPDERMNILNICGKLLGKGGELYMAFPYTKNLNFFVNFVGDWTHKIVDLEAEVAAVMVFGGFAFEDIEVHLGGWTVPHRSSWQNAASILRNCMCLFPPFHVGVIIAHKSISPLSV